MNQRNNNHICAQNDARNNVSAVLGHIPASIFIATNQTDNLWTRRSPILWMYDI